FTRMLRWRGWRYGPLQADGRRRGLWRGPDITSPRMDGGFSRAGPRISCMSRTAGESLPKAAEAAGRDRTAGHGLDGRKACGAPNTPCARMGDLGAPGPPVSRKDLPTLECERPR